MSIYSKKEINDWKDFDKVLEKVFEGKEVPVIMHKQVTETGHEWHIYETAYGDHRGGKDLFEQNQPALAIYHDPRLSRNTSVELPFPKARVEIPAPQESDKVNEIIDDLACQVESDKITKQQAGALMVARAHALLPLAVAAMEKANQQNDDPKNKTAPEDLRLPAQGFQIRCRMLLEEAGRCLDNRSWVVDLKKRRAHAAHVRATIPNPDNRLRG